jgi:hypothetical protein
MVHYYLSLKFRTFLTILRTANAQTDKKRTKDAVQVLLAALYAIMYNRVLSSTHYPVNDANNKITALYHCFCNYQGQCKAQTPR